jgi:hypothetical protein
MGVYPAGLNPVNSEDLTPAQQQWLAGEVGPAARYLNRLCARMKRRAFRVSDPVYVRAISARNSVEALLSNVDDIHHEKRK